MSEILGQSAEEVLQNADAVSVKVGGDNAALFGDNVRVLQALQSGSFLGRGEVVRPVVLTVSALRSSNSDDSRFALDEVKQQEKEKGGKGEGFDTTAHLKWLSEAVAARDISKAEKALKAVWDFTAAAISRSPNLIEDRRRFLLNKLQKSIAAFSEDIKAECIRPTFKGLGLDNFILDQGGQPISLLGYGEDLARELYMAYMEASGVAATEMPNFMDDVFGRGGDPLEIIRDGKEAVEIVIDGMRRRFEAVDQDGVSLFIGGGHQPVVASSRGYSDVVAALEGVALKRSGKDRAVLDVHKQKPIGSADHRRLPVRDGRERIKVVPVLSYAAAGEIFGQEQGADAGAIHPNAIPYLAAHNIPAVVRNPHEPGRGATLITGEAQFPRGPIDVIAVKSNPVAVDTGGYGMIDSPNVLAFIAEFFGKYSISRDIDSAGSMMLCFNDDIPGEVLDEFERELKGRFGEGFSVKILIDLAVVYCVGNNPNLLRQHAVGAITLDSLGIETFGGSHKPVDPKAHGGAGVSTFIVKRVDALRALDAFHENMIEDPKGVRLSAVE